jgi:SAM-dependent methyltransferase
MSAPKPPPLFATGIAPANAVSTEQAAARWSAAADDWAKRVGPDGDRARQVWIDPTFLPLLGDVAGMRLLDAGCGEGYLCRKLAAMGAASVLGVDAAEGMIRVASERTPDGGPIEYRVGDFQTLDGVADASVDLVASNMALMDLPRPDVALAAAHRVLRPGGAIVYSITHPCFQAPESGWHCDANGAKKHWMAGRYWEPASFELEIASGFGHQTYGFHWTLTDYLDATLAAGFALERVVEPRPLREAAPPNPPSPNWTDIPLFLIVKGRKRA